VSAATRAGRCAGTGTSAIPSASFQAVSAGRIRVDTPPGAERAACTARAVSAAMLRALFDSQIQFDTGRAKPAMSDVSGASYCRW
jgi:hypothetical protein